MLMLQTMAECREDQLDKLHRLKKYYEDIYDDTDSYHELARIQHVLDKIDNKITCIKKNKI